MPLKAETNKNSLYRWGVLLEGQKIDQERLTKGLTVKNREVVTLTLYYNDKPLPKHTYFCTGRTHFKTR